MEILLSSSLIAFFSILKIVSFFIKNYFTSIDIHEYDLQFREISWILKKLEIKKVISIIFFPLISGPIVDPGFDAVLDALKARETRRMISFLHEYVYVYVCVCVLWKDLSINKNYADEIFVSKVGFRGIYGREARLLGLP